MSKQEEITKEVFEADYCRLSSMTRAYYNEWYVTLPCSCDYEECRGWAKVWRGAEEHHMSFYGGK